MDLTIAHNKTRSNIEQNLEILVNGTRMFQHQKYCNANPEKMKYCSYDFLGQCSADFIRILIVPKVA